MFASDRGNHWILFRALDTKYTCHTKRHTNSFTLKRTPWKLNFSKSAIRNAGLKNITETEVNGKLNAGTADVYWNMMTEVAAPFVAALSKADEATKTKIKNEVLELVNQKYPGSNVAIESSCLVIYGEK